VVRNRPPLLARQLLVYGPLAIAVAAALTTDTLPGAGSSGSLHGITVVFGVATGVLLVANQVLIWRETVLLAKRLDDNTSELERVGHELRQLLDSLAEAVVVVERSGIVVDANERVDALYGVSRSDVLGRRIDELVPMGAREAILAQWETLLAGGVDVVRPQFEMTRSDGSQVAVEVDARPIAAETQAVVLSLRDVTERRRTEEALRVIEGRFRLAFESAPNGTALIDVATGMLVDVNEKLAQMFRMDRSELIGTPMTRMTHPDDLAETARLFQQVRAGESPGYQLRKRYVRHDGSIMWASISVARLDPAEDAGLLIGHILDITEEVAAAERLAWSATHDEVTGLANRTHFLDVLRRELLVRDRDSLSVLFLDLDRFKIINDSLGHAAGDDLLRTMAGRLRDSVRPGDLVARFGGDEFTVMLRSADHETALEVAGRIRRGLSAPVDLVEAEVDVTASVGLAVASPGRQVSAVAVTLGGGITLVAQAADSGTPSSYTPITPCRLMDTRPAPFTVGPRNTPIGQGENHSVLVHGTNGACTIPANATGIATNTTVTNGTAASFLTLFPGDANRPNASNLNWVANQSPTPNQVTVGLSPDGRVRVYNDQGTVNVIIDIVGRSSTSARRCTLTTRSTDALVAKPRSARSP
jgi:diguanylate cyclase (GGDEF)-like protein/PAS domain S-box-containing protein